MIFGTIPAIRPGKQAPQSLRRIAITGTALAMILGLAACTNPYDPGQRALGGAAIGAGAGAALGAATGGSAAGGALIGGALGAAAGALTTPPSPSSGYGYAYPPPAPSGYYPNMVWLPSEGVYVATNYPRPLFYFGGLYYNFYGGRWYAGPRYNGPWRMHAPPPRLRQFRERHWNDYRDRARYHYRRDPHWRHFEPH